MDIAENAFLLNKSLCLFRKNLNSSSVVVQEMSAALIAKTEKLVEEGKQYITPHTLNIFYRIFIKDHGIADGIKPIENGNKSRAEGEALLVLQNKGYVEKYENGVGDQKIHITKFGRQILEAEIERRKSYIYRALFFLRTKSTNLMRTLLLMGASGVVGAIATKFVGL